MTTNPTGSSVDDLHPPMGEAYAFELRLADSEFVDKPLLRFGYQGQCSRLIDRRFDRLQRLTEKIS